MTPFLLLVLAAEPTVIYSKTFPGSVPPYVEVELARSCAAIYREKPNDDQPVKLRLADADCAAIFALAAKLEHFQRPLESGLKVARMGDKTYRWVDGTETHEQKFNYSTDEDAKTLQDWFEKITETTMHLFALERTVRFDKLGVNKTLLQLESTWDRRRLVAIDQFLPWLNRIVKNESFLNMDRERAEKLAAVFKAGYPGLPAEKGAEKK